MRPAIPKIVKLFLLGTLAGAMVSFAGAALSQTLTPALDDLHAYYMKGQTQAEADARKGVFAIKTWGLAEAKIGGACGFPSQSEIKDRILTEKYKVTFEGIGGCLTPDSEAEFARGYNETIQTIVNKKYGQNVFEKAETDAAKELAEKYSQNQRQCAAWLEGIKNLPARRSVINQ
jgi:hypothetical protein